MDQETKSKKRIMYLDYACPVGQRVKWDTMSGEHFVGTVIKWEGVIATVKLDDGTEKIVRC